MLYVAEWAKATDRIAQSWHTIFGLNILPVSIWCDGRKYRNMEGFENKDYYFNLKILSDE